MQFEEFDKKLREAAENHHPTYNENAWDRMETLLDRHLPQKKDDRRRFIFFILLPLLMAGGTWMILAKPWTEKEKAPIAANQQQSPQEKSSSTGNNVVNPTDNNNSVSAPANTGVNSDNTNTSTQNNLSGELKGSPELSPSVNISGILAPEEFESVVGAPGVKKGKAKVKVKDEVKGEVKAEIGMKNSIKEGIKVGDENKEGVKSNVDKEKVVIVEDKSNIIEDKEKVKSKEETVKEDVVKSDNIAEPTIENKQDAVKEKKSKKKSNQLFFTFSAGPDISSVGSSGPGKSKLVIGAGVGYTFMDRLTLRAGFYSARKMYSATKEDYKPDVTPPNYYYLDNIDADCKVYEIPVTLSYKFGKSTRHHFFAGAGLSSYLMKEEVYDYLYKYPGNPPVYYSHTYSYKNEYKHFFSVLGISGGYHRNLSPTVGISAEPYVRIPLSGVGAGNVKLKSAGVLFSVSVKPFK